MKKTPPRTPPKAAKAAKATSSGLSPTLKSLCRVQLQSASVRRQIVNFKPKLNAAYKAFKKAEDEYKRALAVANNHNEDLNAMELSASLLKTLAGAEKTGTVIAPAFNLPPDEDLNAMELPASLLRTQAETTRRSLFASATTDGEQPEGNSRDASMMPLVALTTAPPPHSVGATQPQDIPPFAGLKSSGETAEDYSEMI